LAGAEASAAISVGELSVGAAPSELRLPAVVAEGLCSTMTELGLIWAAGFGSLSSGGLTSRALPAESDAQPTSSADKSRVIAKNALEEPNLFVILTQSP
jgi:hypothetical protein